MKVKTKTGHEAIVHSRGPRWQGQIIGWSYANQAGTKKEQLSAYTILGVPKEVARIQKLERGLGWDIFLNNEKKETVHTKTEAQIYVEGWLGLREPSPLGPLLDEDSSDYGKPGVGTWEGQDASGDHSE